ncbi:MAG: hypothetical protein RIM99_05075 [Cyclobacteriaceae bacterium]
MKFVKLKNVGSKKTHTNRNRTLIILLGILLAFILTLNARATFLSENFLTPDENQPVIEKPTDLEGKALIAGGFIKTLAEKFTYLK